MVLNLTNLKLPSLYIYRLFYNWQAKRVSNPQPSVLETDTLPIELLACNAKLQKLGWVVSLVFNF